MDKTKWNTAVRLNNEYFNHPITKYIQGIDGGYKILFIHQGLCMGSSIRIRTNRYSYQCKGFTVDQLLTAVYMVEPTELAGFKNIMEQFDMASFKDLGIITNRYWQGLNSDRNRKSKEYTEWRTAVFQRDNYTCQRCGGRGIKLNAHHIIRWVDSEELRYDINNGLTLCEKCHKEEHRK